MRERRQFLCSAGQVSRSFIIHFASDFRLRYPAAREMTSAGGLAALPDNCHLQNVRPSTWCVQLPQKMFLYFYLSSSLAVDSPLHAIAVCCFYRARSFTENALGAIEESGFGPTTDNPHRHQEQRKDLNHFHGRRQSPASTNPRKRALKSRRTIASESVVYSYSTTFAISSRSFTGKNSNPVTSITRTTSSRLGPNAIPDEAYNGDPKFILAPPWSRRE